jgi:hypothetical protein
MATAVSNYRETPETRSGTSWYSLSAEMWVVTGSVGGRGAAVKPQHTCLGVRITK